MAANISETHVLSTSHTYIGLSNTEEMAKKPNPRTFWARLQEALADDGKATTQEFAAKFAGVSQPSVSLWNRPGKVPELETGIDLATRLKVCVEWLYTERGPKRPGIPDDQYAQALWAVWNRLDNDTKRDLVGAARIAAKPPGDDPFKNLPDHQAVSAKQS